MAYSDNSTSMFAQFKRIKEMSLTEQEVSILHALAHGMQPATPYTAVEAAHRLDLLCPPLQDSEEAGNFLWRLWVIIIRIAQSPDAGSVVQDCLVRILWQLKQCSKGGLDTWVKRVWADLRLWPTCFEVQCCDPTLEEGDFSLESAQIWINTSAFAARCYAAGVLGPYNGQITDALRSALEQDLEALPKTGMAECKIQVACEWIRHAAKPLFRWALATEETTPMVPEAHPNHLQQGPLYSGPPSTCLERWRFWMGRFEDLAGGESGWSDQTWNSALEAAETMRAVQKAAVMILSWY